MTVRVCFCATRKEYFDQCSTDVLKHYNRHTQGKNAKRKAAAALKTFCAEDIVEVGFVDFIEDQLITLETIVVTVQCTLQSPIAGKYSHLYE